ncbi:hypothetical protein P5V15_002526 [Pogonomyrmex californicus]
MASDILSIGGAPIFDDRIVRIEIHTYNPYANITFGYSDEIRIPIQQQDLYTLPCESFLYIEGKFASRESAKESTAKEGTAKESTAKEGTAKEAYESETSQQLRRIYVRQDSIRAQWRGDR